MAVQEQDISRSLQLSFFLEGLFSWQKSPSKPQNRAISCTIPSVFQVVVLVRPRQKNRQKKEPKKTIAQGVRIKDRGGKRRERENGRKVRDGEPPLSI